MIRIPLNLAGFPPHSGVPNGQDHLDLSWDELVWAAISVGRGSLEHMQHHGMYSTFEMVYRSAILYANLMQTDTEAVIRSSAYEGLDPSEKSAISYFLGLTLTKAFVAQKLHVPWLMHVDVYRQQFGLHVVPSGGRPDLFGRDQQGRWIVAESKGRTNGHDVLAMQKAKQQTSYVATISNAEPYLRIGFVTSFSGGRLSLAADDPRAETDRSPLHFEVSDAKVREQYYAPFRALIDRRPLRREQWEGHRLLVSAVESGDFEVGLSDDLAAPGVEADVAGPPAGANGQDGFLGIDGVFVRLGPSWSEQRMRLEPQTRGELP